MTGLGSLKAWFPGDMMGEFQLFEIRQWVKSVKGIVAFMLGILPILSITQTSAGSSSLRYTYDMPGDCQG